MLNNQTDVQIVPTLSAVTFAFLNKKEDGSPQLRMYSTRSPRINFGMFGVGTITDPDYMIPPYVHKPNDTSHRFAATLFCKIDKDANFEGLFWKIMTNNLYGVMFEYENGELFFFHPVFSGKDGFEDNTFQDARMLEDGSLFFGISAEKTLDEMLEIYQTKLAPKFEK